LSNITECTTPSNESDNENEYSTSSNTEFFCKHIAALQNDVDDRSSNAEVYACCEVHVNNFNRET
jgi:hypothetical protein